MLHRFEKSGIVIRKREIKESTASTYNWYLTPYGSQQLTSRLALLVKMLRSSSNRQSSLVPFSWKLDDVESKNSQLAQQPIALAPEFRW